MKKESYNTTLYLELVFICDDDHNKQEPMTARYVCQKIKKRQTIINSLRSILAKYCQHTDLEKTCYLGYRINRGDMGVKIYYCFATTINKNKLDKLNDRNIQHISQKSLLQRFPLFFENLMLQQ